MDQQQRQEFLDSIARFEYIRPDGRLVLEPFCVWLSHCFGFDGILASSPQPRDVYMLLVQIIREDLGEAAARQYIQTQGITDWEPGMEYIYPERRMTCIHVSALVQVSHTWINEIGHTLMRLPEPPPHAKYFAWVNEDWSAVHAFINGYHNALYAFLKQADRSGIKRTGYSNFEALHLTRSREIDYDEAVALLKARHQAYVSAMERIAAAIGAGYFLEAVALEESLISNCLFNFLDQSGVKLSAPTLHALLQKIGAFASAPEELPRRLFDDIDAWRKARNNAIHGYITSHSEALHGSSLAFMAAAKETAQRGEEYCQQIVDWYEIACVNFIPHEFPSGHKGRLH